MRIEDCVALKLAGIASQRRRPEPLILKR
jgi:hypothetical protein